MANRVCERCIHYDVCLLHEDNFIEDVAKNGFCGKFKNKDDVAEVKHGYWIGQHPKVPKCSVCGAIDWNKGDYCRYCGAKMDGEENNHGKQQ